MCLKRKNDGACVAHLIVTLNLMKWKFIFQQSFVGIVCSQTELSVGCLALDAISMQGVEVELGLWIVGFTVVRVFRSHALGSKSIRANRGRLKL